MATLIPASSLDVSALQIEQPLHLQQILCSLALELPGGACRRFDDSVIDGKNLMAAKAIAAPVASGWSVAGWDLHPLESAALSRRTPRPDVLQTSPAKLRYDDT
jgi:hypothetical protein